MSVRARRGNGPFRVKVSDQQGVDTMVLSSSQHLLLALSLAMCACFLLPRMLGGGKQDPSKVPPAMHGRPSPRESQGNHHSPRRTIEKGNHFDHMKGEIGKQLKAEKTGTNRSMALTLMPIYAVGVAIFAAYKFSKVKSNEKNKSKLTKDDEKKTKDTENQLLELERHLSQTEKMLNSLLTQLDPLSNCVNTLATEQKDEIMNQLQSIRQLMKKSGMDKNTFNNTGHQSSEDTLEDLIHSLKMQNHGISEMDEENEIDISKLDLEDVDMSSHNPAPDDSAIQPDILHCKEDSAHLDQQNVTRHASDGLRKRNIKD